MPPECLARQSGAFRFRRCCLHSIQPAAMSQARYPPTPSKMTECTTFEAVLQLPRIQASATITASVVAHAHNHLRSHRWRRQGKRPRWRGAANQMRGHRHNVIVGGTPEETSLRRASVRERRTLP